MNDYDTARQVAQALLKREHTPTRQIIEEKVKIAIDSTRTSEQGRAVEVDEEKLVRELESLFNIWMGVGRVLENQEGHIPWLADRNSEINWAFWNRYARYLEEEKGWAPATTKGLDQLTDSILERLENPLRSGAWDRRGMVVGQVQSGKTANYTGLICKAVDAGYKLIIVLAGIQNSLRSQTQLRLDEGFLGYESRLHRALTEETSAIGAGRILVGKRLVADSATNSSDKGDFNRKVAGQFGISAGGGNPLLFVVKKNTTVLKNLLQWALRQGDKDEKSGKRIVRGVPLLIIDDEADNASINTNPPLFDENGKVQEEYDVSAINGLIRKLLHSFEKSAYVGYTATPFANIFIHPDIDKKNQEFGDDLFPRSFIINLPAPSNYIGPVQVFGLDTDPAIGLEASEPLPIIRSVDDQKEWMPDKHKKDHVPGELPGSLKEAIRAFILCCAVRIVRGQENDHNSMLVHVARFTAVQSEVAKQVKDELTSLQKGLRHSDGKVTGKLEEEFEQLWKDDFLPTTSSIISSIPDPELKSLSWEEVEPLLHRAASKIQIKKINGTAKDVLDYWEHKNGLSVIAIGGDKLSRGLTLEGLSVSYYLRASKMYDTLMQMGRWFGYRPGYLDLCRLYTTDELVEWYEHITVASEELRQEFDYMADVGATPDEFGLKVRTHPQGLVITGANKMKTGTVMRLSYTRSLSETTIFYKDENKNQQNLEVTEELLRTLGEYSRKESNNYIWQDVPAKKITSFISGYQSHPKVKTANTRHLVDYINAQLPQQELVLWTVVIISNSRGKKRCIAGHEVGTTLRKNASPESSQEYRLSKSRLLSPTDEWLDLPKETREEILEITRRRREEAGKPPGAGNTPDGKVLRSKRSPKNGLLLLYPLEPEVINSEIPVIGFVLSFPDSKTAQMVEYKVNNVYWQEEFGQL
ncbi:Z1 domain-containing protein [Argonema galeatum]|uniref:Z1 domain-containing protein n=1 Tax=Argonema galeatum TaxID=2942762 RepID=UPI002010E3E9|nr:Z1 domain-containing protein [Argonema galeatum]MCL1465505.1 Z1 domain-containing protein [Argonema galeatum A003/A1]